MFLKVLRDIAKPQWFEIITLLKRSTGMSVAELAQELGMSYMGVKQHCVELQKRGYLDTWRRPKKIGRPEKAYRLTKKADPLFPHVGTDFALALLGSLAGVYGDAASEKLLFGYFQHLAEEYSSKLKGDTLAERTAALSRLRDAQGYLSEVEQDEQGGLRMVEHHSPFGGLLKAYPSLLRMEEHMLERVLGASVAREEEHASALVRYVFKIG